jgi:ditrans,polycis-polyprenyl diphosphate synthase
MPAPHLTQLRKWMLESPPVEWGINQLRELLIGALRQGPIPQHVAFVMDGNRRFARSHKIETVEGHNLGFEALARVCLFNRADESLLTEETDLGSML